MLWEHSGPGEQGVRVASRRGDSTEWGALERIFCFLSHGSNWHVLWRLCRTPLYKFGKLRISGYPFSPSIADFTSLVSPHLKKNDCPVRGAQVATVSLSKEGREVRHCTPASGFPFPQCLQFGSHGFSLRKLLFLANLSVYYNIKLFRELIHLRNHCFSFLTKKGKYWHHLKGTSRS